MSFQIEGGRIILPIESSNNIEGEYKMNETLKTLLTRRSIRKYKKEQITEDELQVILEAGTFAPSAMNQQPWHFTAIQNKEVLQRVNKFCIEILIKTGNKNFQERSKGNKAEDISIMYDAPTLIVVSGDEKAIAPINDCSIALQNMFLAADSLGIGSCWIHAVKYVFSTEEGKEFLIKESIIPEGYAIVGSGAFGYKDCETPSPAPRRNGNVSVIK